MTKLNIEELACVNGGITKETVSNIAKTGTNTMTMLLDACLLSGSISLMLASISWPFAAGFNLKNVATSAAGVTLAGFAGTIALL